MLHCGELLQVVVGRGSAVRQRQTFERLDAGDHRQRFGFVEAFAELEIFKGHGLNVLQARGRGLRGTEEPRTYRHQYLGKMAGVGKRSSVLEPSLRYSSRGTSTWG